MYYLGYYKGRCGVLEYMDSKYKEHYENICYELVLY
jgi:hypothetical protein